jgi:SAM-dependent methyltransferase
MKDAQDSVYLDREADAFFDRNSEAADPTVLRPMKRRIADALEECGVRPRRVLEYGCHYGDLLFHLAASDAECWGVEPSEKAVALGREAYGDAVNLAVGTMAENPVNADPRFRGYFDLVVVDDVLCWVSRETLLRSMANLDEVLADGGRVFLREFLPDRNRRNRNHHVEDAEVWCYKPAGPHRGILLSGGTYAVEWEEVWIDREDAYAKRTGRPLEARWVDTLMRKSLADWFEE